MLAERQLANAILMMGDRLQSCGIKELASAASCSVATVHRLCRKLGLEGFKDLKVQLAKASEHRRLHGDVDINMPFGAGWDDTKVGDKGTSARTDSAHVSAYGSFKLTRTLAVEAMGGYGSLGADNRRYVTLDASLLDSQRSGHLVYGSLSFGGEAKAGRFSFAPYVRNDVLGVSLKGYAEPGTTPLALGFGSTHQTVDVFVAGSRAGYDGHVSWGRIAPVVRLEYRHRFASGATQQLFYLDQAATTYSLHLDSEGKDFITAAAGVEASIGRLSIGLEYGSSASSFRSFSGHTLRGSARVAF